MNTASSQPNQGISQENIGICIAHPTALLTVALKQRTQLVPFPIYKAKLVASPNQGIQCTLFLDSGH